MSGADPRVRAMLKLAPVIPVFTPENVDDAVQVAQALFRGGLPVIEVTLRTACAMDAIKAMVEAVPEAVVGAGTVLEARQMEQVQAIGGRFAVSPGTTDRLYAAARDTGLAFLPGVATSSELMRGLEQGLDTFKFFPALRCCRHGTALSAMCVSARPAASVRKPHRNFCTCPTCCAWAARG